MLTDLENSRVSGTLHSQICIVGAGVAGLLLAHKLAERGYLVHLLEGGGLELEDRSQALYSADMAGDLHIGTTEGRFRVFGGSSTRWGGQLLPYTDDVFAPPPCNPSLPWPIDAAQIERYYAEVQSTMGVDDLPFTDDLLPRLGHPSFELPDSIRLRFSKWAPFRRRNLAAGLGRACRGHANVTVFTHANAVALHAADGGPRVTSITARNYSGGAFQFTADTFVVAAGTIESSRLLLASGVGNRHDQVGRYFHDHLSLHAARISGPARRQMLDRLGPFFVDGTLHTCKLEASGGLRARAHLAAAMAHVVVVEPEDSGVAAVRNSLRMLQRGELHRMAGNVVPMLRGAGDVARLVWASRIQRRRAVSPRATVYLNVDVEQVPRADNRVRLSLSADVLGEPRALVDWHISPDDRATATRYARHIQEALKASGIAPLDWLPGVLDESAAPPPMADTFHPMGGLRMGTDPRLSVVDADLKVHGLDNLHIASCGVFPSGGSSNPTFTLMALTLRLADRLTELTQG